MIDPTRMTALDDILERAADKLPNRLWAFFKRCKDKGFNESQSLRLTLTLLSSLCSVDNPEEVPDPKSTGVTR